MGSKFCKSPRTRKPPHVCHTLNPAPPPPPQCKIDPPNPIEFDVEWHVTGGLGHFNGTVHVTAPNGGAGLYQGVTSFVAPDGNAACSVTYQTQGTPYDGKCRGTISASLIISADSLLSFIENIAIEPTSSPWTLDTGTLNCGGSPGTCRVTGTA